MKFIILFIICLFIWSFFIEPNILTIKHITIADENLNGLKIVFASDFHIKPYEMYRLKRIVKAINKQNADIVLLGGDYVSGHKKKSSMPAEKIAKELSRISSNLGTYGVVGNHDGWHGKDEVITSLKNNNINILFNNNTCFKNFCVAGVDDLQTGTPDVKKALKNIDKPVILLTHTPDIINEIPHSVNLTLAGHLHGGQIRLHKALIVPSVYGNKFANGYVETNGKKIYTSKGLGTSILPLRFNCPPEITVIDFSQNQEVLSN